MDIAHAAAVTRWPSWRSLAARAVATPLQPKAKPAPIIVTSLTRRPSQLSTYGVRLARPRPISTTVIVRRLAVWALFSGAKMAVPSTPSTIAATEMYSLRPGRSPSMRSPMTSSTSSPAASAGCTTTSGASIRAITCSGKPRIESPVPNSQRVRVSSRRASASRRWESDGASRASCAWKAIPRL